MKLFKKVIDDLEFEKIVSAELNNKLHKNSVKSLDNWFFTRVICLSVAIKKKMNNDERPESFPNGVFSCIFIAVLWIMELSVNVILHQR